MNGLESDCQSISPLQNLINSLTCRIIQMTSEDDTNLGDDTLRSGLAKPLQNSSADRGGHEK